jgi:transposase
MIRYFERLPPVLVAIESCGSSHHWGRLLQSFGHEVKLIPPQYVKAYGAPRRRVLPVEEGSTQRVVD